MSRWTHIRGGLELVSSPFEYRGKGDKKTPYYPYPEKQVRLSTPTPDYCEDHGLEVTMYEYSLPRAKKYIDAAFAMLPQGESGIKYAIKQDDHDYCTSSSCFDYPCQKKAYHAALEKMYSADHGGFDYKDIEKYFKISLFDLTEVHHMVLGIREDIRYCGGMEMLEALEKAFAYLEENEIDVEDGYLEWQDEYELDNLYSWRVSRVGPDYGVHHMFAVTNIKTNKIIYKKTYKYKVDKKGRIDYMAKGYDVVEENFGYEPWKPALCVLSGSESEE